MTRITYLISGVCAAALLGACNDLGECGPDNGRVPVQVGSEVMYAGQAIIVQSCAAGQCHSELTTRANRHGVPDGLFFDISPAEAAQDADGGTVQSDGGVAEIASADLQRLRQHQRKVFNERHSIWEQVERNLMPPEGIGEVFRTKPLGTLVDVSAGGCPEKGTLAPITDKGTREILRNWLACGSPIVEANIPGLTKPVGGTIGDQFPACGEAQAATFENFYEVVVDGSGCVAGCHSPGNHAGAEDFDLSTLEIAYASLMGANGMGMAATMCDRNKNFMVTPGKPEDSYFYAKVGGKTGTVCMSIMPLGTDGLPAASLDLVRRWIEAGAPGPGAAAGDAGAGSDAGASGSGMDGGS